MFDRVTYTWGALNIFTVNLASKLTCGNNSNMICFAAHVNITLSYFISFQSTAQSYRNVNLNDLNVDAHRQPVNSPKMIAIKIYKNGIEVYLSTSPFDINFIS